MNIKLMKTNYDPDLNHFPKRGPLARSLSVCNRLLGQMVAARDAVFAEFRHSLRGYEHLLRLALNEAEALAWQTEYPHLVFADLAAEKARAVNAWRKHQQTMRHDERAFAA